jgi:hypothetical protein
MLDTSTVILLGQISDPTELPDESAISAITLAELSVGPHVAPDDAERSALANPDIVDKVRNGRDRELIPYDERVNKLTLR